jgi:hypothetical protein
MPLHNMFQLIKQGAGSESIGQCFIKVYITTSTSKKGKPYSQTVFRFSPAAIKHAGWMERDKITLSVDPDDGCAVFQRLPSSRSGGWTISKNVFKIAALVGVIEPGIYQAEVNKEKEVETYFKINKENWQEKFGE